MKRKKVVLGMCGASCIFATNPQLETLNTLGLGSRLECKVAGALHDHVWPC